MSKDLDGKTILLTGATEGIGKTAALRLAERGAGMTLVGRNREKSERVVAELKAASGNDHIELIVADLATLAGMRAAADAFLATHDRLDVLVNNAGAVFNEYVLTADGFERTFALNHLGYFVITMKLLDLLKKTPGARIVSTSSGAHNGSKMTLADLDTLAKRPGGETGFKVYSDSKLANILFTRELGRRLEGSGVVANCFHPGFVDTGFGQNNRGPFAWAIALGQKLWARTPEKGAETLVWLAASPDATKVSGEYFFDMKVKATSTRGDDVALSKALWALSEKLSA